MKQKNLWFIALLMTGAISTGRSQIISPYTFNAGGGYGTLAGNTIEVSIGEMSVIQTGVTPNLIVTFGVLQPLENTSVLPVTLIRFGGTKMTGYNKLDWATGTETGHTQFELQRSNDATSFSTIYSSAARGLANGSNYTFNDSASFQNRVYYRLKITEAGGAVRYSAVVLIQSYETSSWVVFPNPAKPGGTLTLNIQNGNGRKPVTLTLSDATGRVMYNRTETVNTGAQTIMLPAPSASGTYLLSLTGIPNSATYQKIIIR